MINQTALCKLITTGGRNIVNLKDNGFQYCNGYMIAECNYDMDRVLSKLLKVGTLKAGKELKASQTTDLSKIIETPNEAPAFKTDYVRTVGNIAGYVFRVGSEYYTYNKTTIDVFEGVTYTAAVADGERAILKAYQGTKFVGLALNMRIKADVKMEIQEFEVKEKAPAQS
jgi:hypothetical protein